MSSDLTSIQAQFNINDTNSTVERIYEFADFRLEVAHLMLYKNEQTISLAPKVVETLLVLIERRGEIVSRGIDVRLPALRAPTRGAVASLGSDGTATGSGFRSHWHQNLEGGVYRSRRG